MRPILSLLFVVAGASCERHATEGSMTDTQALEAFHHDHHPEMSTAESSLVLRMCVAMRTPREEILAQLPPLTERTLDLVSEFAARTHRCGPV